MNEHRSCCNLHHFGLLNIEKWEKNWASWFIEWWSVFEIGLYAVVNGWKPLGFSTIYNRRYPEPHIYEVVTGWVNKGWESRQVGGAEKREAIQLWFLLFNSIPSSSPPAYKFIFLIVLIRICDIWKNVYIRIGSNIIFILKPFLWTMLAKKTFFRMFQMFWAYQTKKRFIMYGRFYADTVSWYCSIL